MEPDLRKGTVTISGEAKDLAALLDYIKQLGTRDVFGSVLLQNHQIQQADPEKPMRFSLLAVLEGGGAMTARLYGSFGRRLRQLGWPGTPGSACG